MNWTENEIKEEIAYLAKVKKEADDFSELIDGVEKISVGFAKIAKWLKSTDPFTERIERSEARIQELKKEDEELKNQEAEASQK